jgi:hypothetical protein
VLGTALVVYHSVFWQFLDQPTQRSLHDALADAGRHATRHAPLAWVRLETHPDTFVPAELRVTVWEGQDTTGDETLLATTGFHTGPITRY